MRDTAVKGGSLTLENPQGTPTIAILWLRSSDDLPPDSSSQTHAWNRPVMDRVAALNHLTVDFEGRVPI